jgi:hypothetical protein
MKIKKQIGNFKYSHMKKILTIWTVIIFITLSFNINAATITIINNTNWSAISPAPTSADVIQIGGNATLTVDVPNGVCASIQVGMAGSSETYGVLRFNSGSQVTVSGDVSLGINFKIGYLDMLNGGTLKIGGVFTAQFLGIFTPGSGTVEYNGTVPQIVLATSWLVLNYNNVTINNPAGVTLGGNVTVGGTLKMLSGNITTGANTLMLGTRTSNRGTLIYNSGSIITGSTGAFFRWFTNSTVSDIQFPVGTSTNNNMITLSFTSAPTTGGSLTARFIPSDPGIFSPLSINDAGYTVDTYSARGYWQLDAGNNLAGGIYTIKLRGAGFNPPPFVEITNYPQLRVIKRADSRANWAINGNHVNATGSNTDPTFQRSGLSGFSQFAMGGNFIDGNPLTSPLPVEFSSFTFNVNTRDVTLNWVTATETNNSGFKIQRQNMLSSNQYSEWADIGFVKGNGTKNTPTNYSYKDVKLNSGNYKYRLKQIDFNGNYEYFNLLSEINIGTPKKFEISQNYPNPFNPTTSIDYSIPFDGIVSIKLYDISGKEILTILNENKQAGYYTTRLNAGNLSSGTYFYIINATGNGVSLNMTKKMLLIK